METPKMFAAKLDREELQNAIRRNEYELFTCSGKSDCWKTFCKLRHRQTKEEVFGVACCNCCKKCLLYKIRTNEGRVKEYGTKNLKDHARRCNFNSGPVLPAPHKAPRGASTAAGTGTATRGRKPKAIINAVAGKDNDAIRRAQCTLVASANLPYEFVDGARFKIFSQKLISLGARYGNVGAERALTDRSSLRNDATAMMRDVKNAIRQALTTSRQQSGSVAFSTELWTDHAAQRTYLDLTFFWIEESGADRASWALRHAMYACRGVPPSDSGGPPSPRYVEETLNEILQEAGCVVDDTPVTTNCGNYVVAATRQKTRIDCACHRLNTVVATAWERCKGLTSIAQLDDSCRALVRYVRRSTGIQSALDRPLKLGGRARPWRALGTMLGSVLSNCQAADGKLRDLLGEHGREHLLDTVDASLLAKTVAFLGSLDAVFDVLEFSAIPTLQNVAPGFYLLRNMWDSEDGDPTEIRRMKMEFVTELDRELWVSVSVIHLTATFLDPSLKSFAFVRDPGGRAALIEQARTSVLHFASTTMSTSSEATTIGGHNSFQKCDAEDEDTSATKVRKLDPFAEFRTPPKSSQQQQQQQHLLRTGGGGLPDAGPATSVGRSAAAEQDLREELSRYESSDLLCDASPGLVFDPLAWWGLNKYKFPILSMVAKIILVIPGSSSESDRVRVLTGAEKQPRKSRARIKVDELEAQVLVAEGIKSGLLGELG